jgi:hypothetical protein
LIDEEVKAKIDDARKNYSKNTAPKNFKRLYRYKSAFELSKIHPAYIDCFKFFGNEYTE